MEAEREKLLEDLILFVMDLPTLPGPILLKRIRELQSRCHDVVLKSAEDNQTTTHESNKDNS